MKSDAEIIADHQWRKYDDNCRCLDLSITFDEYPAHLAAMLHENRTITTREELDALPHLTLIREFGRVSPSGRDYGSTYERWTPGWRQLSGAGFDIESPMAPPLTVVWHPEFDGGDQ